MREQRLQVELRMAHRLAHVEQARLAIGVVLDHLVVGAGATQWPAVSTRSRASAAPVQKLPCEPTIITMARAAQPVRRRRIAGDGEARARKQTDSDQDGKDAGHARASD